MRREYITYLADLPITMSLINILQYPIHWHDSIEILFVLKGVINITLDAGHYEVYPGEIEIINSDEAHSIQSNDEENRVLSFHIEPSFFEKYFKGIRNVFFYTNSSETGAQEEEKYCILRSYLSILACEAIQKQDKYEDYIEDTLVDLLYHLINNFHQLIYEKDNLKENEEQFERYDRIVRYIYNNYKDKISLQDIAKREYLSSDYLSHEIKNTMGYGFKDLLNLTRVEESIKFLLDTDKSISEISDELGFSHSRYFNKHFKKHYKCTPLQYRKKYKIDDIALEKLKKFTILDIKDTLEYISIYLEDYDRFNYENKIIKLNIDASLEGEDFNHDFMEIINMGKAKDLLKESHRNFLINIQKDVDFKYAMLYEVFSIDMGVICSKESNFFNWSDVKNLIQFLISIDLRPFIVIQDTIEYDKLLDILNSFIYYFREEFGDYELGKWRFQVKGEFTKENIDTIEELLEDYMQLVSYEINDLKSDSIYDTCYMIPYIIQNFIQENKLYFKAFDNINYTMNISNELFFGDSALITQNGIKKPSYYAYYFLSKLGNKLIYKDDGCIVTKMGEDIQILLCSYSDEISNLIMFQDMLKRRGIKNTAERKFSLNISNLFYDYKVVRYEINEKVASAYDYWVKTGKPKRLTEDELELLSNASFPKISFSYAKKSNIYNIIPKVQGYGAVLIILKKVQKHLY